ncbi:MAG: rod shape-determining protein MreC [Bacteroidaceae bacterium]|nr:rod shape-determining protein MreC [Bacteroidaceae bacterium]
MRKLLDFLRSYNYWFLFVLLEVTSFTLLIQFNNYQQGTFFTSANRVTGKIYEMEANVTAYFHLKESNQLLLSHNTQLEIQIAALQKLLQQQKVSAAKIDSSLIAPFVGVKFIPAEVVNNQISEINNYITLNKGAKDGIKEGMGVIGSGGVVGIVHLTSSHYSLVISLLNIKSRISCKVANTGYFGTLRWIPGDSRYAFLEGIPRHARCKKGNFIVTSGYSEIFPAGARIGRIFKVTESKDGLSYTVCVALSSDFGNLTDVRVIAQEFTPERTQLEEEEVKNNDDH